MSLSIVTLAERPDLESAMWHMHNDWPEFMLQDPVGDAFFGRLPDVFPDYQLVAVDDDTGAVEGKVNAIPFAWDGTDADLPARGWDAVQERGFAENLDGRSPTAVSLLEARVSPDHRGSGLVEELLDRMDMLVNGRGIADLFGPVRPTRKAHEPLTPMADYVARVRDDGLPADPWLRSHVRRGGRVVVICPASMTIPGTLAQWREWTGLPFTESGPLIVPGALTPVHVDVAQDHAVYVEPNVWVHHRVGGRGGP